MAVNTGIEWTDSSWSPLRVRVKENAAAIAKEKGYTSLVQIAEKMAGHVGPHCEHVSPGCENCYSGTNNHRCLPTNGTGLPFDRRSRDLVKSFVDEKILMQPHRWKAPKRIFVENQSDLFGEWVSDEAILRVFCEMGIADRHTYQVLTKRGERMLSLMPRIWTALDGVLPNVWLGVSVENLATWDARVDLLKRTPAAKRFVSYEPALECLGRIDLDGIDWLITGGESGSGARPAHPDWFRQARDQCIAASVAYFHKQNGAFIWRPTFGDSTGKRKHIFDDGVFVERVGKKAAGALLDGKEWKQFPEVRV